MACRAAINCRTAIAGVLRDMWRAAEFATAGDKIGGVKVFVAAHGATTSDIVLDHAERGGKLSRAVSLGQSGIDDERVTVLHHQMPHVAELGFFASALRNSRASGSVVEEWVSFRRFSPWKSRSVLRPLRRPRPCPRAACGPPSARWPRLRSACRRRRSVRWRAGGGLAAGSERSQRTWPRYHRRAANLGSCRRRWHPTPDRPPRAQRTSGTTYYSRAVPSIAVPIAPCRTPAAVALATVAPAGSTVAPRAHRPGRTRAYFLAGRCRYRDDHLQLAMLLAGLAAAPGRSAASRRRLSGGATAAPCGFPRRCCCRRRKRGSRRADHHRQPDDQR